jgi:hypothetical protein
VAIGALAIDATDSFKADGGTANTSSHTNIGGTLVSGGTATINAGKDVTLDATALTAKGDIGVTAGGTLTLSAEADTTHLDASHKSDGFLTSSSRSTTQDTQTWKGANLASTGGSIALKSGGNTLIDAAKLDAAKHITIQVDPSGALYLKSEKNIDSLSDTSASDNGVWQKAEQKGHYIETVQQVLMTAGEGFTIIAPGGIKVDYRDTGNLDESIAQLSKMPGLEYLGQLRQNPNVDWVKVNAAYKTWDHKSEGLSGPMSALIMIAVALATAGSGAAAEAAMASATEAGASAAEVAAAGASALADTGFGASTLGLTTAGSGAFAVSAANAAMTTLIGTATIDLIGNKGDLGKTFAQLASTDFIKNLAIAGLSAGIGSQLDGLTGLSGDAATAAKAKDYVTEAIAAGKQQLLNAAVSTALQTTIGGQPLDKTLKSALQTALAQTFGQVANSAVGDVITDHAGDGWKPGGVESVVLHGMVGYVQGQLGNGKGLAGAFGAAGGEALTPMMSDYLISVGIQEGSTLYNQLMQSGAQALGTIIGTLVAGGAGATAGGSAALSSVTYNYLSHPDAKALDDAKTALEACEDAACKAQQTKIIADIQEKDAASDAKFIFDCQDPSSSACQSDNQDRRNAQLSYAGTNDAYGTTAAQQSARLNWAVADKGAAKTVYQSTNSGGFGDSGFDFSEVPVTPGDLIFCNYSPNGLCGVTNQVAPDGGYLLRPASNVEAEVFQAGEREYITAASADGLSNMLTPFGALAGKALTRVFGKLIGNVTAIEATSETLPQSILDLSESHITDSGNTVLGRYPGYVDKAIERGASYFDIGPTAWDALGTDELRWAANRHFLDVIAERGDKILLSVPKTVIPEGSWLAEEVKYLTTQKGYRWVNQWSLKKVGG